MKRTDLSVSTSEPAKTSAADSSKAAPEPSSSIRSVHEIDLLKKIGVVKILSIHGSIDTRIRHLKDRSRSDAPSTLKECLIRDKRELSVGLSEAIAFADEIISNNEISLHQLKEQAKQISRNWLLSLRF